MTMSRPALTHDEALDLAAALRPRARSSPPRMAAVREHLATCPESARRVRGARRGRAVPAGVAGRRAGRAAGGARRPDHGRRRGRPRRANRGRADDPGAGRRTHRAGSLPVRGRAHRPGRAHAEPARAADWVAAIAAVLAIARPGRVERPAPGPGQRPRAAGDRGRAVPDRGDDRPRRRRASPAARRRSSRRRPRAGRAASPSVASDGSVQFAMQDLAPTSGSQVYETWAILPNSNPVPLGSFTVDASGVALVHLEAGPGRARDGRRGLPRAAGRRDRRQRRSCRSASRRRRRASETRGRSAAPGTLSPRSVSSEPLPADCPRSSADCAAATIASASVPSAGNRATPAETDTRRPPIGRQLGDAVEDPPGDRRTGRARAPRGGTRRRRGGRPCRRAGPRPRAPTATDRSTSSPASRPPASFVAAKSSTSKIATETSLPCRPARASSSSRTRANVRRFARPVSGSVWASRSNHSERSATVDASRDRSTATAARSATARRNAAWSSLERLVGGPDEERPRRGSARSRPGRRSAGRRSRPASAISARSRAAAVSGWSGAATAATRAAWAASSSPTVKASSASGRSGSWRLIAALVAPTAARRRRRASRAPRRGRRRGRQRRGTGGERRRAGSGRRVASSATGGLLK